jgi:hypothetical protein
MARKHRLPSGEAILVLDGLVKDAIETLDFGFLVIHLHLKSGNVASGATY